MLQFLRSGEKPAKSIDKIEIVHAGETLSIALKRLASARRYTLRVRAATRDVILTMPTRGSLKQAQDFAERHAAWIGARLARLPERILFAPGAVIPLRGLDHLLRHCPKSTRRRLGRGGGS